MSCVGQSSTIYERSEESESSVWLRVRHHVRRTSHSRKCHQVAILGCKSTNLKSKQTQSKSIRQRYGARNILVNGKFTIQALYLSFVEPSTIRNSYSEFKIMG